MTAFKGFPAGDARRTPLPDQFFSELLPAIGDLAELKVTLHIFWRLHRHQESYLSVNQLRGDATLLRGLESDERALERGLEKAVSRGTLLRLTGWQKRGIETLADELYFLNDEKGRQTYDKVEKGKLLPDLHIVPSAPPVEERPDIHHLYEQHIGLLSPIIVQELDEAAETYPALWIKEAFQIAVERGVRRWRYIHAILERWRREGKK